MDTVIRIKTTLAAISLALVCGTATAQSRYHHAHCHGVRTVVIKPVTTSHVDNRFTQQERLTMAVTYIKNNRRLTAKKYAKLTGLPLATAETELNVFASSRRNPIARIAKGKRTLYVMEAARG